MCNTTEHRDAGAALARGLGDDGVAVASSFRPPWASLVFPACIGPRSLDDQFLRWHGHRPERRTLFDIILAHLGFDSWFCSASWLSMIPPSFQ